MAPLPAWPVTLSLLAGLGAFALLLAILPHRDKPGGTWFLIAIAGQATWSFGYAVALVTFAPGPRMALGTLVWLALVVTGITFFGFSLAYTGRSHLIGTWWFRTFLGSAVGVAFLVLTNPVHGLVWRSATIEPVMGLATVAYDFGPVAYLGVIGGSMGVLTGSLLLFDTVLSYGRPYHREAIAVGVSTIPPVVGLLTWLLQLGPVPSLNLTTVLFVPHVALDLFAFVGSDMFEFHPATRRTGERAAIEDLEDPVFIVDQQLRIVTLNAAAESTFGLSKAAVLTRPLEDVLDGGPITPDSGIQTVTLWANGRRRGFRVSPSSLSNGHGTHLGYTLLCQDVTRERQRKQRLEVLNRILRHNLRNDLTVVSGLVAEARRRSSDEEIRSMLDRAGDAADDLATVGEKAREIEQSLDPPAARPESVDIVTPVRRVAEEARAEHPTARIGVELPPAAEAAIDPQLLESVLRELLENAIVHNPSTAPRVTITVPDRQAADVPGDCLSLAVSDDGPGLPEHELEVIQTGTETDLAHGTGLGLWLVVWGVRALNGSLSFSTDATGTTVTIHLPT